MLISQNVVMDWQSSLAHYMACLSVAAAFRTMYAEEVAELKIR